MRLIYIFIFGVLYSGTFAQTFILDDTSPKVNFKIKNFGSTVDGSFNELKRTILFDASKLSDAKFDVTVIASAKPNEAIITGKLTIKKTTKEISFQFSYSVSDVGLQFKGEFKIDRKDFGVRGNSFSLSDEVNVLLHVKAQGDFT